MYYVGYVAYFQLNIDYIVDTYCVNKEVPELQCNGKCHLAKQLSVVPVKSNSKYANLVEAFYPLYYHQFQKIVLNPILTQRSKLSFYYQLKDYNSYLNNSFKPPQV